MRHFHSDDDEQPTVGLYWVRGRLGCNGYGERRLASYLSLLIAEVGFPPPLPILVARRIERGVTSNSRWVKSAVLAWLEDFLPPANAAQVDAIAMREAAAEMDARAGQLRLIKGGAA